MRLIKWANEKIKKWDMWDIGCVKWASIIFGIIVGAYISDFVKKYLLLLIVLAILLAIRPVYRFLKK